MRYVRYLCILIFAVAIIAAALANREMVTLKLLPDGIAGNFAVAPSIQLPLFVVILGSVALGLVVGLVWEWLREFGQRSSAAKQERDMRRMEREVARLKDKANEGQDDVLALLDKAG